MLSAKSTQLDLPLGDPGPIPDCLLVKNRDKPMPVVGSYSLFNTLKVCAHQCFRRYFKKDIPYKESPEMKWGNEVHTAMELRVGGKRPLPPTMAAFEQFAVPFDNRHPLVEIKLGVTREGKTCDFLARDVYVRGKLDVVVVEGSSAYMGDHKTGNTWEDPFELEVGATLLHAWQPHLQKIVGQYNWLKNGVAGKLYDLSNTDESWRSMQNTMVELQQRETEGKWEKRKNKLCAWCKVYDCEHNPGAK